MRNVILILLTLSLVTSTVFATNWQVPGDAPTIQGGLDLAQPGDTVTVACGTYYEHDLLMASGVTLRSETGRADCVIIDAQQQGRVMKCDSAESGTALIGLTFTGGNLPGDHANAGGVWCVDSSVDFTDCDFVDNYAGYKGGGLLGNDCTLDITDCRFIGNEGEHGGGGGVCYADCEGSFIGCLFENNRGIDGAGFFCARSSPTLEWCTFLNNDGWFFGGAIFCVSDSSPVLTNCTLVGNEAILGAGIDVVAESFPILDNCIIAFNVDGAGIYVDDYAENWAYLTCCDVYGNTGGGYAGLIEDQTGLNGNLADDPLFCDLEAGDLTVAVQSHCLPENNDCGVLMGAFGEGCVALPVDDVPPLVFSLAQNRPNPFNPRTVIHFELPDRSPVSLAVYTLDGRRVVTLIDQQELEGRQEVIWNGQDSFGQQMSSGSYFYRLEAGAYTETKRMTLIR